MAARDGERFLGSGYENVTAFEGRSRNELSVVPASRLSAHGVGAGAQPLPGLPDQLG